MSSHLFSCLCTDFLKQTSKYDKQNSGITSETMNYNHSEGFWTNSKTTSWRKKLIYKQHTNKILKHFGFVCHLSRGRCWSFSSRTTEGWLDWGTDVGIPTVTFRSGDKNAGYSIGCGIITFLQKVIKLNIEIIHKCSSKTSGSYHFWITLFFML